VQRTHVGWFDESSSFFATR